MRKWVASKTGFPLLVVLLLSLPLGLAAYSYVRIVRLSFVEGDVQVTLPGRVQPTRGLLHLPLEHGAVVETPDGVAVVEFEDEALARLAPHTRLHLEELLLLDNGERVTQLFLERGTGTFNVRLRRGDSFEVVTPYFQLTVPRKARFRVDVGAEGGRVRVFKGKVTVAEGANLVQVSKKQMFELDSAQGEYRLVRDQEWDQWDEWNDYRDDVRADRLYSRQTYPGARRYYYSHSHWAHYADPFFYCSYFQPFYGWSAHYGYWPVFFGRHSRRSHPHGGGYRVPSQSPPPPTGPHPSDPERGDEGTEEHDRTNSDRHREGAPPFRGRPGLPTDLPRRFAPEPPERLLREQRERFGVSRSAEPAITSERDSGVERRGASRRWRRAAPARRGAGGREAVRGRAPQALRHAAQVRPSRSQQRGARQRPSATRSRPVRSRAPRMQSRIVRSAPRAAASRSQSHRKHN